jgi:hypothetical protein
MNSLATLYPPTARRSRAFLAFRRVEHAGRSLGIAEAIQRHAAKASPVKTVSATSTMHIRPPRGYVAPVSTGASSLATAERAVA